MKKDTEQLRYETKQRNDRKRMKEEKQSKTYE